MRKYEYEIISGIVPYYIEEYFSSISKERDEDMNFYGLGWQVKLIPQHPKRMGVVTLPVTRIVFTGDEEACKKVIKKYRMKFLSAGG